MNAYGIVSPCIHTLRSENTGEMFIHHPLDDNQNELEVISVLLRDTSNNLDSIENL